MNEGRYVDTDFSLRWMHKDVGYALALAEQFGVTLNAVAAAERVFRRAHDKGLGDQDMAAVYQGVRE
jgi:3-hydroxyisobutyrate dehydrogenase-like beta-hydroxyacid dehydrogenase